MRTIHHLLLGADSSSLVAFATKLMLRMTKDGAVSLSEKAKAKKAQHALSQKDSIVCLLTLQSIVSTTKSPTTPNPQTQN